MRWISIVAALAAVSFATSGASASWTASVSGRVVDVKTLEPVAHANIMIFTESGSQVLGKAKSDADGAFMIGGLRGGDYRLQFDKGGYQKTIVAGLFIRPAERLVEAAPIAMYPNGVPLPNNVGMRNPCGGLVMPAETADVYIICSGE